MPSLRALFFLSITCFILTSCASSYKSISPETIRYINLPENDGLSLSYQADVLGSSGNKKLARKEDKFDIRIVAVKVINNTGRDINFSQDLDLLVGQNVVQSLHPKEITSKIKQSTPAYLLYLLLTPVKLYDSDAEKVDEYSIGYALGPGLTAINMILASEANSDLIEELTSYDLYNRTISDGETVYGLIGLSNYNFGGISLRLKN